MRVEEKIKNANNEHLIRELSLKDEIDIQQLCIRCGDYFLIMEERIPDSNCGNEILNELPPNKAKKDKLVLGVYNDCARLIAVIDIIRGYKIEDEWTIGLMIIDPDERGKGLGEQINDFIKKIALESKAAILRLGVVEGNHRAYKFWTNIGYKEVGRVNKKFGDKEKTIFVMNYNLR
ncbi:Acetyltransferase (GNAT) family protein [Desulfotomaculum arcticum]|uniref:Acetyltransferase (GNAT) family protein n=1 Tax=Desulfotruncus arcticus DSM 17038 TaxID=1121424 RepID=A0A1I2RLY6_9FIRM|nr:GNAT family N-acetyltransferase [Desulfotruncus arcticus]SFG41532.1 Acetyltransferase (GNAT) family protein [Desulfotomaculum arcticum] [Desulfotruncus arcticus DSM 17038]